MEEYMNTSFVFSECDIYSALLGVVESKNTDELKVLIDTEVAHNRQLRFFQEDGATALLRRAVESGDVNIVVALVDAAADVNILTNTGVSVLMCAAGEGHVVCLRILLEAGAEVNLQEKCDGMSALMMAAARGREDCVESLIAAGAMVNLQTKANGLSALAMAAASGSETSVKVLLEAGAEVSAAAFMAAVEGGHGACVVALVDAGAEINRVDERGVSPLMKACQRGDLSCVILLIDAGADVNLQKNSEELFHSTPLMWAIQFGHFLCVRELVEAGADANVKNRTGWSALMLAAVEGECECVKELIDAGADLNLQADEGRTALILAALRQERGSSLEMVNALVMAGADVTLQDNLGKTALFYVCENYDLDRLKLFEMPCLPHDYRYGAWCVALVLLSAGAGMGIRPRPARRPTTRRVGRRHNTTNWKMGGAPTMVRKGLVRRSGGGDYGGIAWLRTSMATMRNMMMVYNPEQQEEEE